MTGTDGRPELVVEGSNSLTAGWKEYHFLYKPGDVSSRPTFLSMYDIKIKNITEDQINFIY